MDYVLENEKRFQGLFLVLGITSVTVDFNGGGDSGSIDDIIIKTGEQLLLVDPVIFIYTKPPIEFNQETNQWETPPKRLMEMSLKEALEAHVNDVLEDTGIDWYNNDGGFGHWEWCASTGLDFKIYTRTVSEDCEHSEERMLGKAADSVIEELPHE